MKQIKSRDKAFLIVVDITNNEGFKYLYKMIVFASTEERAKMKALDKVDGVIYSVEQVRSVI